MEQLAWVRRLGKLFAAGESARGEIWEIALTNDETARRNRAMISLGALSPRRRLAYGTRKIFPV